MSPRIENAYFVELSLMLFSISSQLLCFSLLLLSLFLVLLKNCASFYEVRELLLVEAHNAHALVNLFALYETLLSELLLDLLQHVLRRLVARAAVDRLLCTSFFLFATIFSLRRLLTSLCCSKISIEGLSRRVLLFKPLRLSACYLVGFASSKLKYVF